MTCGLKLGVTSYILGSHLTNWMPWVDFPLSGVSISEIRLTLTICDILRENVDIASFYWGSKVTIGWITCLISHTAFCVC